MAHVLRDVVESDLDAFYEHQREPEATEMALFPARDREAFDAHWRRILADDSAIKKTIVHDRQVAGNIGCWEQDGRRLLGYWVGKEFWGWNRAHCRSRSGCKCVRPVDRASGARESPATTRVVRLSVRDVRGMEMDDCA